jgi:L-threonylcarbamoyladenylate synthase
VLAVQPERPDAAVLEQAAQVLLRGGLVAFATETVYGLGAIATLPDAVARVFAAKGRPAINPVIVHVAGIAQARQCVAEWTDAADSLAREFWPGPLTLVLKRSPLVPDVVTAGRDTVAVRVPASKVALGLIHGSGKPIAAPSANRSSHLSPTRAEHVVAELAGSIDMVIDSGPTDLGLESTVIDLTLERPQILRPGPISRARLERVLGSGSVSEPIAGEPVLRPSSPGQMAVHYAPRTPTFRIERDERLDDLVHQGKMAVVSLGEQAERVPAEAAARFALESPEEASRRLYEVLHQCDALELGSIVVLMPPDEPEWQAVRDRLLRAARALSGAE